MLNSARDICHMFWYGMVRVGWVEWCGGVVGKIIHIGRFKMKVVCKRYK